MKTHRKSLGIALLLTAVACGVCYFCGKSAAAQNYNINLLLIYSVLLLPAALTELGCFVAGFIPVSMKSSLSGVLRVLMILALVAYVAAAGLYLFSAMTVKISFFISNPWIFAIIGAVLYWSLRKKST